MARLTWDFTGFPSLDLLERGTPFTYNVRRHLKGPDRERQRAKIQFAEVRGMNPAMCGLTAPGSGDFLKYDGVGPLGSGSFKFKAV